MDNEISLLNIDMEEYNQIKEVITNLAQDLLVVETVDKREVLVPFVKQIVTNVDLNKKQVVMDPPTGLFDEENAIDAN